MPDRKKVVVTGASSGIGYATAQRFAREGWDVCVTSRRAKTLEDLVTTFPPGHHLICPGDYSDPSTVETINAAIKEHWGRLDCLANVAGTYMAAQVVDSPLDEWRKPFDIMVNGAVYMTRMAVPWMKDGGSILHCTSIHSGRSEIGSSAYAMAKAAIDQYVRGLAMELAGQNILVNAVAPGFIRTEMSIVNGVSELDGEWFRVNYVENNHLAMRRPGLPEEVSGVFFFLAGPDASYITGQVITVDGGLTITF